MKGRTKRPAAKCTTPQKGDLASMRAMNQHQLQVIDYLREENRVSSRATRWGFCAMLTTRWPNFFGSPDGPVFKVFSETPI